MSSSQTATAASRVTSSERACVEARPSRGLLVGSGKKSPHCGHAQVTSRPAAYSVGSVCSVTVEKKPGQPAGDEMGDFDGEKWGPCICLSWPSRVVVPCPSLKMRQDTTRLQGGVHGAWGPFPVPRTVDFFTGRRCERVAVAVMVARSSPEPHRNGGGTHCAIVFAVTTERAFPRRFGNRDEILGTVGFVILARSSFSLHRSTALAEATDRTARKPRSTTNSHSGQRSDRT